MRFAGPPWVLEPRLSGQTELGSYAGSPTNDDLGSYFSEPQFYSL